MNKVFKWFFLLLSLVAFIGALISGRVDLLCEAAFAYLLSKVVTLTK